MARHGTRWDDGPQLDAIADFLSHQTLVGAEALMTHFASADDPSSPQTGQQQQYFATAIKRLYALGLRPPLVTRATLQLCSTPPMQRHLWNWLIRIRHGC